MVSQVQVDLALGSQERLALGSWKSPALDNREDLVLGSREDPAAGSQESLTVVFLNKRDEYSFYPGGSGPRIPFCLRSRLAVWFESRCGRVCMDVLVSVVFVLFLCFCFGFCLSHCFVKV